MFVTKKALPRRTMLRGLGASLALPLLDAMVPAATAAARVSQPVKRLGFVYLPNGAAMPYWTPRGEGRHVALSPSLVSLEPFTDHLFIPSGLSQVQGESWGDGNGDHARGQAVWLCGVHPKKGGEVQAGITADQIAARTLGKDTRLASLEIALEQDYLTGNCDNGYSCVYENTIAWRTPTMPLPMEVNPRVVFERLFGDGGTAAERLDRAREDRSILDWVTQDIGRLEKKLGPGDRLTVVEYLDAVREIERRIQVAERQSGESALALPARPIGIPEAFDDYARLMFDLQWLALKADVTRVFTFLLGREQSNRPYPQIGVPDAHHAISHHQLDPVKVAKLSKINQYHVGIVADFLAKLRSTPDGEGSLFDHSLVLLGAGLSDSDQHSHRDLPLVLAGGGGGPLGGGVRYPIDTPMNNLLVAMLDKVGVEAEHFGDATGEIDLQPLSIN